MLVRKGALGNPRVSLYQHRRTFQLLQTCPLPFPTVKSERPSVVPFPKFQDSQFKIVEMAAEIKLGRTFLDKLVMGHIEWKKYRRGGFHGQILDRGDGHEGCGRMRAASRWIRLLRGIPHCEGLEGHARHVYICENQRDYERDRGQIRGIVGRDRASHSRSFSSRPLSMD